MRLNNKGQALVEFVLILPVFLMILFVIVDFGMIFSAKSSLENTSSDIIELYKNNSNLDLVKNTFNEVDIEVVEEVNFKKLIIRDKVNLITPGMNRILSNPYEIKVERVISYVE